MERAPCSFQEHGDRRPHPRGKPVTGRRAWRALLCTSAARKSGRRPRPPPQGILARAGGISPEHQHSVSAEGDRLRPCGYRTMRTKAGEAVSQRPEHSEARKHAVAAGEVPEDSNEPNAPTWASRLGTLKRLRGFPASASHKSSIIRSCGCRGSWHWAFNGAKRSEE